MKWKPILIEWTNKAESEEDSYYWAMDLCKTFSINFAKKPEIIDLKEKDTARYICKFSKDEREFKIEGIYGDKRISLAYIKKVSDVMQKAVEIKRRRIEANSINPQ